MEIPSTVRIYNDVLGIKGSKGRLLDVSPKGHYEVILEINGKQYAAFLPVSTTIIISNEAEPTPAEKIEVER
jgi:hypothetical protein